MLAAAKAMAWVAANFVDAGEQSLKNIARPVRVCRLDFAPRKALPTRSRPHMAQNVT